jgi:hypothetical protein
MRKIAALLALVALLAVGVAPVAADTTGGGATYLTGSLDPTGTITKLGIATISGTVSCDDTATAPVTVNVGAQLVQPVGRLHSVNGNSTGDTIVTCVPGGGSTAWSVAIVPYNGKFGRGGAMASVWADACDAFGSCASVALTGTVKLGR